MIVIGSTVFSIGMIRYDPADFDWRYRDAPAEQAAGQAHHRQIADALLDHLRPALACWWIKSVIQITSAN